MNEVDHNHYNYFFIISSFGFKYNKVTSSWEREDITLTDYAVWKIWENRRFSTPKSEFHKAVRDDIEALINSKKS